MNVQNLTKLEMTKRLCASKTNVFHLKEPPRKKMFQSILGMFLSFSSKKHVTQDSTCEYVSSVCTMHMIVFNWNLDKTVLNLIP